jgi:hypothetical protein
LVQWEDVDCRWRVITAKVAYAKNGKARSVPLHHVLTATLKAMRMNATSIVQSVDEVLLSPRLYSAVVPR